jgi:hypothetical protein
VSLNQPDLDLLADFVGGALDGTPDEQRIGERIRTDAEWAQAYADLVVAFETVSADLQTFGAAAESMPDDVWGRLEAALSSATPSAGPPKQAPSPQFTAPRDNRPPARRRAKRRRWMLPVLAAVAVLAALSLGFALRGPLMDNNSATHDAASAPDLSAPQIESQGGVPTILRRSSGRDYVDGTLVLATDFGSVDSQQVAPQSASTKTDGFNATSGAAVPKTADSYALPVPAELRRLTDPAALDQCLRYVAQVIPGTVLGVDYATYKHKPAVLVVMRTSDEARWVGVVGADCGIQGADLLTRQRIG